MREAREVRVQGREAGGGQEQEASAGHERTTLRKEIITRSSSREVNLMVRTEVKMRGDSMRWKSRKRGWRGREKMYH